MTIPTGMGVRKRKIPGTISIHPKTVRNPLKSKNRFCEKTPSFLFIASSRFQKSRLRDPYGISAGLIRRKETVRLWLMGPFSTATGVKPHENSFYFLETNIIQTIWDSKSERIDLSGIDLSGANMHLATFFEVNLGCATLERADLPGATLNRVHMNRAPLRQASLARSSLLPVKLREANFRSLTFKECDLRGADFRNANVAGIVYNRLGSIAP